MTEEGCNFDITKIKMSESPRLVEEFKRQGRMECPGVSSLLHIRYNQTAVEILAGTHPILRAYATEDGKVMIKSVGTGREVCMDGGKGIEVGRDAKVLNSDFIGADAQFVSREHCRIEICEYDEKDGHPIIQITDHGSKNHTFYEILVNDSSAQAKAPEKHVERREHLIGYAVGLGESVKIPFSPDNSGGYNIFDESGRHVANIFSSPSKAMVIMSAGYEGGNQKFGSRVDINLSVPDGGSADTHGRVAGLLKWKGQKIISLTFEGNSAQPIIKNLGVIPFVVKVVPHWKPGG